MHRINNQVYRFIAHPWEKIINSGEHSTNKSLGELVLKYLEKYIYQYPEEWYQWKKVPEIKIVKGRAVPEKERKAQLWLKPAFGRIP